MFLLIGSGTAFLINYSDFKDSYLIEPTRSGYEYLEMDITIEKRVYIYGTFADVQVELYDENSIKIEYEQFDEYGPSFILINSKESIKIDTNNPKTNRYNISPFQKRDEMDVIIYLPRTLEISDLYIHTSGNITLDYETEMQFDSVRINSIGGDIEVSNMKTTDFAISKNSWKTNGSLNISDITADKLTINSSTSETKLTNMIVHTSKIYNHGSLSIQNYVGITEDYRDPATLSVTNWLGGLIASNVEVYKADFRGLYSSSINITGFSGNEMNIENSVNDIIILDVNANKVSIKNSNGNIIVEELAKFDNDENNVVIEILRGDVEMRNVYASKVVIDSDQGDILYHNEDLEYEVELDITMYDTSYNWIKDIIIKEKQ